MNGVVFHVVNLSNSHHVLGNDPYIEKYSVYSTFSLGKWDLRRGKWLVIIWWLKETISSQSSLLKEQTRIFPKCYLLVNLYQRENRFFFLAPSFLAMHAHVCMHAHTHIHTHYVCMHFIYWEKRKERRKTSL